MLIPCERKQLTIQTVIENVCMLYAFLNEAGSLLSLKKNCP